MNRARRIALAAIASVTAAVAIAPSAFAASDYFLKIDGIAGETQTLAMKGAIDVNSFGWGVENPTAIGSATGGAGTGKAQFDELTIDKAIDAATPAFFGRLGTGQPYPAAELIVRKAGAGPTAAPYLRYCFTTVFVTDQEQSGSRSDDAPQETVKFRFGAVSQQYTRQITGPTAPAGTVVSANWSQILNRPFTANDANIATCK
jgi:type VI secretion system secreted protein Hcp